MIIETRSDVVRLSGSLHKNQWLTIRAAAGMLLRDFPEGIIVDCSQLQDISEDGARTFMDAIRDIEAARSRIIVTNLPHKVLEVLRKVPGVRSQLPIAETVEDARASLRMRSAAAAASPIPNRAPSARTGGVLVVPLIADVDLSYGAELGARIAMATKSTLQIIFLLEVARTLPLNAPLLDLEELAQSALAAASARARGVGASPTEYVERVRDSLDGALALARSHNATSLVIGTTVDALERGSQERFDALVETLLHRATCEVVVGRLRQQEPAP